MISLGQPIALAAGVLLAALVTALHFFAPRPPGRAPLPTARFLREDTHTTLRFRRRPTDVPVMALRALLALLLGLLFAQPSWLPARTDDLTRIVLLDRGVGMAGVWNEAKAAATRAAGVGDARVVTFTDGLPSFVDASTLDEVAPADRESSYLNAFRALRIAGEDVMSREVEAVLITRPRWSAWDTPLGGLRDAAWPGALAVEWIDVSGTTTTESVTGMGEPDVDDRNVDDMPRTVPTPSQPSLAFALGALGYTVVDPAEGETSGASAYVGTLRFTASTDLADEVIASARRGDTVVVFGNGPSAEAPAELTGSWDPEGWPAAVSHRTLRVGGHTLPLDGVGFLPGRAVARNTDAALLPIVLDDGTPVAVGESMGSGCLVRFGGPIDVGANHPAYPQLVRALADGCRSTTDAFAADAPLDSAARAVLEGAGSTRVDVASLGLSSGTPLRGWVLLLASLVALAESWLVRRASAGQRDAATKEALA